MAYDYLFSWVYTLPDGTAITFVYASPFDFEAFDEDSVDFNIPTGELSSDGQYQFESLYGPRSLTMRGTLQAPDPNTMQTYLDQLMTAHPKGRAGQLFRHSGRYLNCQVAKITRAVESADTLYGINWSISFMAGDPFYYDAPAQTPAAVALTMNGNTVIALGGSALTYCPVFTFNVTTAGGAITLVNSQGDTLSFTANVTGAWTVDCLKQTITGPPTMGATVTADGIASINSGEWLELLSHGDTITTTLTGGAVATGTVQAQRRWVTS